MRSASTGILQLETFCWLTAGWRRSATLAWHETSPPMPAMCSVETWVCLSVCQSFAPSSFVLCSRSISANQDRKTPTLASFYWVWTALWNNTCRIFVRKVGQQAKKEKIKSLQLHWPNKKKFLFILYTKALFIELYFIKHASFSHTENLDAFWWAIFCILINEDKSSWLSLPPSGSSARQVDVTWEYFWLRLHDWEWRVVLWHPALGNILPR